MKVKRKKPRLRVIQGGGEPRVLSLFGYDADVSDAARPAVMTCIDAWRALDGGDPAMDDRPWLADIADQCMYYIMAASAGMAEQGVTFDSEAFYERLEGDKKFMVWLRVALADPLVISPEKRRESQASTSEEIAERRATVACTVVFQAILLLHSLELTLKENALHERFAQLMELFAGLQLRAFSLNLHRVEQRALQGENRGKDAAKGGKATAAVLKMKATAWQLNIEQEVRRLLRVGMKPTNIGARLAAKAGQSAESVRKYAAAVRKAGKK